MSKLVLATMAIFACHQSVCINDIEIESDPKNDIMQISLKLGLMHSIILGHLYLLGEAKMKYNA